MDKHINPEFRKIFEGVPAAYLILSPSFVIVAVSDAYLSATMTRREEIINRGLFDVFPDNPADPNATGVKNLTDSLNQVLKSKATHTMAIQKYDIPRPASEGGGFEERWWRPQNSPILNKEGEVVYIVHHVEDVTSMLDVLEDAMDKSNDIQAAKKEETHNT